MSRAATSRDACPRWRAGRRRGGQAREAADGPSRRADRDKQRLERSRAAAATMVTCSVVADSADERRLEALEDERTPEGRWQTTRRTARQRDGGPAARAPLEAARVSEPLQDNSF